MLRFVTRFLYACDKLHVTWLRFEKKTAYKFAGGGGEIVGPASVYIRGQLGGTR